MEVSTQLELMAICNCDVKVMANYNCDVKVVANYNCDVKVMANDSCLPFPTPPTCTTPAWQM